MGTGVRTEGSHWMRVAWSDLCLGMMVVACSRKDVRDRSVYRVRGREGGLN